MKEVGRDWTETPAHQIDRLSSEHRSPASSMKLRQFEPPATVTQGLRARRSDGAGSERKEAQRRCFLQTLASVRPSVLGGGTCSSPGWLYSSVLLMLR